MELNSGVFGIRRQCFNTLNAVQSYYCCTNLVEGSTGIHCLDVALKFMWILGNRCPQWFEVQVNLYVTTKQY